MSHAPSSLKPASQGSSGQVDPLTNIDDLDAKVEAMIKQADEIHQRVTNRQDGVVDETAGAIEQQTKAAHALAEQAKQSRQDHSVHQHGDPLAASGASHGVASDDLLGPIAGEEMSQPAISAAPAEPSAALSAKESLQRAIEEAMKRAPSAEQIAERLGQESAITRAAEAAAMPTPPLAADADVPLGYGAADAEANHADAMAPATDDEFADVNDVYAQAEASGQISMIEPPLAPGLQAARPELASALKQRQAEDSTGAATPAIEPAADTANDNSTEGSADTASEFAASSETSEVRSSSDLDSQIASAIAAAEVVKPKLDLAELPSMATAIESLDEDPAASPASLAPSAPAMEPPAATVASAIAPALSATTNSPAPSPAPNPTPILTSGPASALSPAPALSPGPAPAAAEAASVQALDEQLAKALAAAGDDEFADGGVLVEDQSLDDIQPVAASPAPAPVPSSAPVAPAAPTAATPAPVAPPPAAKPAVGVPTSASMAPLPPVTKTAGPPPKPATAPPPAAPPAPLGPTLADRFWAVATPVVEPIAMRLGKLPASLQQTVGWIGLSTLFIAGCTWIYVIGFQPTIPASQLLEAERAAAAAKGDKKPAGEHSGDDGHESSSDKKSAGH